MREGGSRGAVVETGGIRKSVEGPVRRYFVSGEGAVETGTTVVQGRDVGAVGANDTEAGRSSYGVPDTGDKFEGEKAEGLFFA